MRAAAAQALGGLARLVRKPAYREALLEGLAAAAGGLDGALAAAAAAALGDALLDAREGARLASPARRAPLAGRGRAPVLTCGVWQRRRLCAGLPTAGCRRAAGLGSWVRELGYQDGCRRAAGELEEVGAALLAVWARHARSQRLATPLLRLADVLLAHAGLGRLRAPRSAFPGARGERAGAPGPEWACRAARMITRGPCNGRFSARFHTARQCRALHGGTSAVAGAPGGAVIRSCRRMQHACAGTPATHAVPAGAL